MLLEKNDNEFFLVSQIVSLLSTDLVSSLLVHLCTGQWLSSVAACLQPVDKANASQQARNCRQQKTRRLWQFLFYISGFKYRSHSQETDFLLDFWYVNFICCSISLIYSCCCIYMQSIGFIDLTWRIFCSCLWFSTTMILALQFSATYRHASGELVV